MAKIKNTKRLSFNCFNFIIYAFTYCVIICFISKFYKCVTNFLIFPINILGGFLIKKRLFFTGYFSIFLIKKEVFFSNTPEIPRKKTENQKVKKYKKTQHFNIAYILKMVPSAGFGPATYWLQISCSTNWAKKAKFWWAL